MLVKAILGVLCRGFMKNQRMRTLLCLLLLFSTVFAEGVIELSYDGQQWLKDGKITNVEELGLIKREAKDLRIMAPANTEMEVFHKIFPLVQDLEGRSLMLALGDETIVLQGLSSKEIELVRRKPVPSCAGSEPYSARLYGLYGKVSCCFGGWLKNEELRWESDVMISKAWMHADGRGKAYYESKLKELIAHPNEIGAVFVTSKSSVYADYFEASKKWNAMGVKKAFLLVDDSKYLFLAPIFRKGWAGSKDQNAAESQQGRGDETQVWFPDKEDFGEIDPQFAVKPLDEEVSMVAPADKKAGEGKVRVTIMVEAKVVSINGEQFGVLKGGDKAAANKKLKELKAQGDVHVSIQVSGDAPQSLVLDAINLLVAQQIDKVTFEVFSE
ncbi:hypothetical protein SAMN02745181_2807 [Rubritalea squalenifaciens DSM 18772]|uniref:Uncharacterized protein n=2 Tax=Rubritalea squalenifaciens TaxID=407226 RepID=A0A1M6NBY0_9BACT|nr:hypothetical protein SAMN02745181_2807 [Rubritalea squalenifaciens DSM 18772]